MPTFFSFRPLLLLLPCIVIALSLIPTANAKTVENTKSPTLLSAGTAINTAGRQRMLSERIVKAYIQISMEVDMKKAQTQLIEAQKLFKQQLQELKEFAPTKNISDKIKAVETDWEKVSTLINQPITIDEIPTLIPLGELLVEHCHQVVLVIEKFANSATAALVNTSGRQRMLSQRMAKYYFAHLAGQKQDSTRQRFEMSLAEFEQGLITLSNAVENTPSINKALHKVKAQLSFSKSGFKGFKDGHYIPHVISRTTESMLRQMEGITLEYQNLYNNSPAR